MAFPSVDTMNLPRPEHPFDFLRRSQASGHGFVGRSTDRLAAGPVSRGFEGDGVGSVQDGLPQPRFEGEKLRKQQAATVAGAAATGTTGWFPARAGLRTAIPTDPANQALVQDAFQTAGE